MPVHDWTKVRSGTFHNFHVLWTAAIANRLNAGLLPSGFFAMAEQIVGRPEADVVALLQGEAGGAVFQSGNGHGVATIRPKATFVSTVEEEHYARKANRIAVHHELGNVVAVIEIVSPGNKDSRHALRSFVDKAVELLRQGVNLLLVDLFPPGPRDPEGIHAAIWNEITDDPFALPQGRPLTVAAYQAAPLKTAYVEPIAVGQALPDMPLFLHEVHHVYVPLEETYQTTWNLLPRELKSLLESSKT